MLKKLGKTNRRGFLTGMLASAGAAATLAAAGGKVRAAGQTPGGEQKGPVLYKRGPETERYFKTLDR